jgi:hypothetical protein
MGYLNKSTLVLDAILTNKGRDYLRKAVFGENQNGEHVIVKWALSDDEIDYGLWDETVSNTTTFAKPYGKVIDNQPVMEPNVNWRTSSDSEIMQHLLLKNSLSGNSDQVQSEEAIETPPSMGPAGNPNIQGPI